MLHAFAAKLLNHVHVILLTLMRFFCCEITFLANAGDYRKSVYLTSLQGWQSHTLAHRSFHR
jgi:hypothetical protein